MNTLSRPVAIRLLAPASAVLLALLVAKAAPGGAVPGSDSTPAVKHILLVTGNDYPGHLWRKTAPALKALLEEDARLTVDVLEDPNALGSTKLDKWDALILHFMNWETPSPGQTARENLRSFVEQGKGLMLTHFACGAWQDWPQFRNIVGRVYDPKLRPHDPYGKFNVDIADPQHPITKGLQPFETTDELYTCLTGDTPIHVIASARSKVDSKDYPMAFVLQYGQGRVFHTVLGHDVNAITNSAVPELLRRGCAWTARLPLPDKTAQAR